MKALLLVPVLILLTACTSSVGAPPPSCEPPLEACSIAIAPDGGFANVDPPRCVEHGKCYVLN